MQNNHRTGDGGQERRVQEQELENTQWATLKLES